MYKVTTYSHDKIKPPLFSKLVYSSGSIQKALYVEDLSTNAGIPVNLK